MATLFGHQRNAASIVAHVLQAYSAAVNGIGRDAVCSQADVDAGNLTRQLQGHGTSLSIRVLVALADLGVPYSQRSAIIGELAEALDVNVEIKEPKGSEAERMAEVAELARDVRERLERLEAIASGEIPLAPPRRK